MIFAILASAVLSTNAVLSADASAADFVASCRLMMPETVSVEGRIVLRNRRGMVQAEHSYSLVRSPAGTELVIDGEKYVPDGKPIKETDVMWSDLTLDYLDWNDYAFDAEKESETVHGQVCSVIDMKKGDRLVKVWVDRKTGALMQAEEYADGKAARRLWGTRVKKFGDRWAPNVLEVEKLGSGRRTKITVEKLT